MILSMFISKVSGAKEIGNGVSTELGRLPAGYRPKFNLTFNFSTIGGNYTGTSGTIFSDTGAIACYLPTGQSTSYYAQIISYPV